MGKKIPTASVLKKRLDKVFSEYIRRTKAKNEICICVTCGKRDHYKEMDAGHYVSRRHLSTRFDERNVWPQCKSCNRFNEGRKDEYALFLIRTYGDDILQELKELKDKPAYNFPYEDKIKEYRKTLKDL